MILTPSIIPPVTVPSTKDGVAVIPTELAYAILRRIAGSYSLVVRHDRKLLTSKPSCCPDVTMLASSMASS